jgi:hypothetical protein
LGIVDDWIDANRDALKAGGDGNVRDLVEHLLALVLSGRWPE